MAWNRMTLPRSEGGEGMHDFKAIQQAVLVEHSGRLWTRSGV